jgi:hypothetical protein
MCEVRAQTDRASSDLDAVGRPIRSGLLVGGAFPPHRLPSGERLFFRIPDKLIAGIRNRRNTDEGFFSSRFLK